MTAEDQIETQAETIERLRIERGKLEKRVDIQQGMIDWLRARVADLEDQTTDEAIAERLFK